MAAIPLLIGDSWLQGSGEVLQSINPANGTLNYEISGASLSDVDHAVAVAENAARQPAWRNLLPHERARLLSRIADLITANSDALAHTQMQENGKVISECRAQAVSSANTFRYYAAVCEATVSEVNPSRGPYLAMTIYEPFGVVAAITPWNSPLTLIAQKVAPAVAAGNAIIVKPSELTSKSALDLARLCVDAGLPPGIINILPGSGAEVGAALVRHAGVRMITFTGGTSAGRAISNITAERLVPALLELGGKSPQVVFEDANLEAALEGVVSGIFGASGQSCTAGSRLFLQKGIYDAFLDRLLERAKAFRVGHPSDPSSQMGPLASFIHRERIERYIAAAQDEGGHILAGGRRPAGAPFESGAFYLPTIIGGLTNAARACQEEIFGPVLCVLPFSDEDDLVTQANQTVYGLACGIWTADYRRAWRIGRAIDAGTIWVNTFRHLSISTPFGGFKESGIGREKGIQGMRIYQQAKSFYWDMNASSIPG